VGYKCIQPGKVLGKLNIVKLRLTANKVVQREIIYPITNINKIILVADLALDRKAWKKKAIPT
jgi:hypothetical protein